MDFKDCVIRVNNVKNIIETEQNTIALDDEISALISELNRMGDPEAAHYCADRILVALARRSGMMKTANAYEQLRKLYA